MSRPARVLLLFLVMTSCCTSFASQPRASPRPGDPALDGKDYLLSEADFRAIIAVARAWLAKTHPSFSVRRVHVITRNQVEVYLRGRLTADYGAEDDMHSVELKRGKREWRITAHNLDAIPTIH